MVLPIRKRTLLVHLWEMWMQLTWTNRRVLIVEDNAIVAMPLVAHLEDCGAEVIGPVPTLDAALASLEEHAQLDGAVLDVELGSDKVWPLAMTLTRREIPFVFATGSAEDCLFPPSLLIYPRLVKPYAEEVVADALLSLIAGAPAKRDRLVPAA